MKTMSYSIETKYKTIEMKEAGYTVKEIMEALNIKNSTQVKTWWRWYRNGETYRFYQQRGKQYTYGKGTSRKILNNDVLKEVSAVNKKKIIELDPKEWYFSTNGIQSSIKQVKELKKISNN